MSDRIRSAEAAERIAKAVAARHEDPPPAFEPLPDLTFYIDNGEPLVPPGVIEAFNDFLGGLPSGSIGGGHFEVGDKVDVYHKHAPDGTPFYIVMKPRRDDEKAPPALDVED